MRDPVYQKILSGLDELSDGNAFEECAVSLLREKYSWLTWVSGGGDDGFDGTGTTPDGKKVLLSATIQGSVIGNMTKNIEKALKEGLGFDVVIVATNQRLTGRQRKNIEGRVTKFGKEIYATEDKPNIAELLYHSPRWRKELLRITGSLPAISKFPKSDRPLLKIEPAGRDSEIQRLSEIKSDLVISGQPGSGKTHLLLHVCSNSKSGFIIDDNISSVLDAVREQEPEWIIVDDAGSRLGLLRDLKQARLELDISLPIVATCWPSQEIEIRKTLAVPDKDYFELPLLRPKIIKEVINAAGVYGPDYLMHELIHQAKGRPGLAVTLARLCFKTKIHDILSGRALAHDLIPALNKIVGKDTLGLLSFCALAGDTGLSIESAAKLEGMSPIIAQQLAETIGAAGVLKFRHESRISVEPARLRHAIVAQTHCNEKMPLDWRIYLDAMPDRIEVLKTIICAGILGGKVTDQHIRDEILDLDASGNNIGSALECYSEMGREQSLWAIEQFPERLTTFANSALKHCPEEALYILLKRESKKETKAWQKRDRLSDIKKWIHSSAHTPRTIEHRRLLLDATIRHREEGGDESTILSSLDIIFSLRFERVSNPPGEINLVTFGNGSVPTPFVSEIAKLWPRATPILKEVTLKNCNYITEILHYWIFPSNGIGADTSEEHQRVCHNHGKVMLSDIISMHSDQWFVIRKLQRFAEELNISLPDCSDVTAKILFPPNRSRDNDKKRAEMLAQKWLKAGSNSEAPNSWVQTEHDANLTQSTYPDMGREVISSYLAKNSDDPLAWLKTLIAKGLSTGAAYPFIKECFEKDPVSSLDFFSKLIENQKYEWLSIIGLLRYAPLDTTFWSSHNRSLSRYAGSIGDMVLRNELNEDKIHFFLVNGERPIRREVASHLWSSDPEGDIPKQLEASWRKAVIECVEEDYQLENITKANPELAIEWLQFRLAKKCGDTSYDRVDFSMNHYLDCVIASLSKQQRSKVILGFPDEPFYGEVFAKIVDWDLELLETALNNETPSAVLEHCIGEPDQNTEGWAERVMLFGEYGWCPEDIFYASYHQHGTWTGSESSRVGSKLDGFRKFVDNGHYFVRKVCDLAISKIEPHYKKIQKAELEAEIEGRFY